jgi:hypothetical protein
MRDNETEQQEEETCLLIAVTSGAKQKTNARGYETGDKAGEKEETEQKQEQRKE